MNPGTDKSLNSLFELSPKNKSKRNEALVVKKRRSLIGASQACDIVIDSEKVSSIHAILEIVSENNFRIYDMNSEHGTCIDGAKVVAENCRVGTKVMFGDQEFEIKNFNEKDLLPPPLDVLSPNAEKIKKKINESRKIIPPKAPDFKNEPVVPRLEFPYPLSRDPKADLSEYIFEEPEEIFPIFRYQVDKSSVEVIILFKGRIQSIDFLPVKNGVYKLVGMSKGESEVEVQYPYLGKTDKIDFIEVRESEVLVYPLSGYRFFELNKRPVKDNNIGNTISLVDDNILRFQNGDIQIYVRLTEAPPLVAHAPIMKRDDEFKKYLLLMFTIFVVTVSGIHIVGVDKEVDKEKIPERIATILYEKEVALIKKVALAKPKENEPTPVKKTPPPEPEKTPDKEETKDKPIKIGEGPQVTKGQKAIKGVPKASSGPAKGEVPIQAQGDAKLANKGGGSPVPTGWKAAPTQGTVDAYKSADFGSSISGLLAKGAQSSQVEGNTNSVGNGLGRGTSFGVGDAAGPGSVMGNATPNLKRAKVSQNVGSLTGGKDGLLEGSSGGAEGIVDKKSVYTAGLPYKTVILGGMDPNTIRQILIEHIPQFRACYQKELDKSNESFDGIVRLDFMIGATGHVSSAGVESSSGLTDHVKGCVVNVLKGIKFPAPRGGGVVEVRQPFNFYPRQG